MIINENELKSNLLNLGCFIENESFDKYCELICSNGDTPRIKFKTQRHHIIPRYYFKYNGLSLVDKGNVVNLYSKEHIIAHWYLSKCVNDSRMIYANEYAIICMLNILKLPETEEEVIKLGINYGDLYTDYCMQMSKMFKGRPGPSLGKKASEDTRKKLSESHKGIKQSIQTREKRSQSLKDAYKNGKHSIERPKEMRQKISQTLSGNKILHKETEEIRVRENDVQFYLENGWEMGYANTEERKQQFKTSGESFKRLGLKGKIKRMTNGVINHSVYTQEDIDKLLEQGFWFGMTKKLSNYSRPHKKYKYLNNGEKNVRVYTEEDEQYYMDLNFSYGTIAQNKKKKEKEEKKILKKEQFTIQQESMWTLEQDNLIRSYFNEHKILLSELLDILVDKSYYKILKRARYLGISVGYNYTKVRCVETGEIFKSTAEAAKKYGVTSAQISRCLRGERKTSCGFHWEKIN